MRPVNPVQGSSRLYGISHLADRLSLRLRRRHAISLIGIRLFLHMVFQLLPDHDPGLFTADLLRYGIEIFS